SVIASHSTLMLLRRGIIIERYASMAVRQVATGNQHFAVRAGLSKNPEKTLFVDGNNVVSYGDFQKWTGRYANVLNGKYGIAKGDRVLCRTSKTLDAVALYMACLQLGAIYIPVNPEYTRSETEHFVKDATPKLMVTCKNLKDSVFRESIANVLDENSLSEEAREAEAMLDIENVVSSDVACVCYTSGTTGLPKGAMLTHGSLSSNAEALVDAWRFTENDSLLHMLPFYHVHGMFISLNCSLFSHSTVIWRDRFSLEDCMKWLPSATVMMGVPTYYSRLLSAPGFSGDVSQKIRLFVSGSAPLSIPVWEEFKSRTGHAILERYGMTEAQVICSHPYNDRRPGSVGKPVGDTKLRINKNGGVEIKGSSLFAGYWKNPTKTAQEFTDDKYFITGDLGAVDDDGFLHILGRGKDLIITGGYNVYAKEIEDCIDRFPDVGESAIIGVPHRDLGEVVVAVVKVNSTKPFNEEEKEREIITALKDAFVKYKVPRRVVFVPALPRNSMAKVQKKELRERYKHICDEH
uniref:AMP-dependent synthetase and ligase domain containing protein n=2 Tax=Haemonchus contortus TaxID=6289 RepID=A0A7I4Z0B5_HAECO